MPFQKKLSDDDLKTALSEGLSVQAMAAKFNMARSSIQWRVQRLRDGAVVPAGGAPPEVAAGDQAPTINTMAAQLLEINRWAVRLLREALKGDKPNTSEAIRLMQEVRQQLQFQTQFLRDLYDIQRQAEFQAAILGEIEAEAPEVQARIIARLKEWRALRGRSAKMSK